MNILLLISLTVHLQFSIHYAIGTEQLPVQQRKHSISKYLTKAFRSTRSLLHREKFLKRIPEPDIEQAYQAFVEGTKSRKMEGNGYVYKNWKPKHCVVNALKESTCHYYLQTVDPVDYNVGTVTVGSCVQKEIVLRHSESKYYEWVYPCGNAILANKKNDVYTFENLAGNDGQLIVTGHYAFERGQAADSAVNNDNDSIYQYEVDPSDADDHVR